MARLLHRAPRLPSAPRKVRDEDQAVMTLYPGGRRVLVMAGARRSRAVGR